MFCDTNIFSLSLYFSQKLIYNVIVSDDHSSGIRKRQSKGRDDFDMFNTAVIPGSFDPVTLGHIDLVERSLKLFRHVIVAVSCNTEKKYMFSASVRLQAVRAAVARLDRVDAVLMDGLLAEFVKDNDAVLVKGVRGAVDFDYEKSLYDINHSLSGVETIILPAKCDLQFVSSTFVRELIKYNRSLDGYVPEAAIPFLVRGV